jgi:signal transduction histidine kinase
MSENNPNLDDQGHFFREMQIELLIHDLKDPVAVMETGIRSLLERRETNGPLTAKQERTLKRVLRSIRKTRSMMYNLLEIGRSQAGCINCSAFSPLEILFETLLEALEVQFPSVYEKLFSRNDREDTFRILLENGIDIQLGFGITDLTLMQDETKFHQIVGNLIKNALQYRKELLCIWMNCEQSRLIVEIQDDGPGIPKEFHETVFHRYTQVKGTQNLSRSGHGLGLAGARIMARCMGGDIAVISDSGMGAKFRVVLPLK